MIIFIKKIPKHLPDEVKEILEQNIYPGSPADEYPMLLLLNGKPKQTKEILEKLLAAGVLLSENKKEILALKIKRVVSDIIETERETPFNLSVLIADKMEHNYTYLSNIFSEVYSNTIEQFIIHCKVAKAKKMLKTPTISIRQIAATLRYSSAAHFSYQFKSITGITPTEYRKIKEKAVTE